MVARTRHVRQAGSHGFNEPHEPVPHSAIVLIHVVGKVSWEGGRKRESEDSEMTELTSWMQGCGLYKPTGVSDPYLTPTCMCA